MNKRLTREACIKIIEQAERTEAEFADCFTAAVTGDSMHDIYKVRYPRCSAKIYDGNHKNAQKVYVRAEKPLSKPFWGISWYLSVHRKRSILTHLTIKLDL